jgi:hypothetical protein
LTEKLGYEMGSSHFGIVSCAVVTALGGLNAGQRMLLEQAYRRAQEVASRPNRWRVEQWNGVN